MEHEVKDFEVCDASRDKTFVTELYMWPYFSLLYMYYLSSLSDKWLDSGSVNNFADGSLLTHRKNKRIRMKKRKLKREKI